MVTNYLYAYIKQVSFGIERRNRFGVAYVVSNESMSITIYNIWSLR